MLWPFYDYMGLQKQISEVKLHSKIYVIILSKKRDKNFKQKNKQAKVQLFLILFRSLPFSTRWLMVWEPTFFTMITKLHHRNSNDKQAFLFPVLDHRTSGPEVKEKFVKLTHEKPISTLYFTWLNSTRQQQWFLWIFIHPL